MEGAKALSEVQRDEAQRGMCLVRVLIFVYF